MKTFILENTNFYVRLILSLAFLGHGLVSLNLSDSYILHYNLIQAINFTSISSQKLVEFQGYFDILISIFLIINFKIKNRNNDYFEMLFDLEVKSSNHVDEIINALKVKQVVQYIDRDKNERENPVELWHMKRGSFMSGSCLHNNEILIR